MVDAIAPPRASSRLDCGMECIASVLDCVAVPVMAIEPSGVVRWSNLAFSKRLIPGASDASGRHWADVLRCGEALAEPEGCGGALSCKQCILRQVIERTLASGQRQHSVEVRIRPGEGDRQRSYEVSTSLITTPEAETTCLIAFFDVTERRALEEELRKEGSFARKVLDTAAALVVVLDHEGAIVGFNRNCEDLTGYTATEVFGRRVWDFLLVPEEIGRVKGVFARLVSGLFPNRADNWWVMRGGGRRLIAWSNSCITRPDGSVEFVIATGIDITEQKEAEEALKRSESRYRLLFERNLAGVYRSHIDGSILECNESFARIYGYSSREEMLGESAVRLHPDDAHRAAFLATLCEKGSLVAHESRARRKDGSIIWILENANLLEDDDGVPAIIEGTLIDVTPNREMEEQLRQAQKMEAVGRLAGGVAHDFNNLLQAVAGFVLALQNEPLSTEQRGELLDELNALVERGAHLTNRLLVFSRSDTSHVEDLDINEVVNSSEKLLRRLLRENIALEIGLWDGSLVVRADRVQLEQVLINLAVNAQDAMPGGGRLLLQTRHDQRWACLEVVDSGHGMPPEVLTRIFDPFFTTKAPGQGTGLGLSVVHSIIAAFDGIIDVGSEVGVGTTFRILIPIREGLPAARPAITERSDLPSGDHESILVVEDDDAVREGLVHMLTTLGYEVTTSVDVRDAIEHLEHETIHLVMADMVLPDGTGVELIDRIRATQPELACVLMSGYATDVLDSQADADSSFVFLQKPFRLKQLAFKVRLALETTRR
jgi:two-component system cell cycle sensor histidine kinase/response regulator CckA